MTTHPVKVTDSDGSVRVEQWEEIEVDGLKFLKLPETPFRPSAGTYETSLPIYLGDGD